MKKSAILTQARSKIKSGEQIYICLAIQAANGADEDKKYLLNWVEESLEGKTTYPGWVIAKNKDQYHKFYARGVRNNFKTGRVAWLTNMINELKAEGL